MTTANKNISGSFTFFGKNARKYLATTALTAGLLSLAGPGPALADNWTDHVVTGGTGSINIDATSIPNTTNIIQTGDFVKVRGDGDINADWTVNLNQPGSGSKYVLFDTENDPTKIMGKLNANGQVYIFDQNGVIFGKDSQVNVGSIVASTGLVTDADINNNDGKLEFINIDDNSTISLNGNVTVADAGLAGFVAKGVENNGVINAKMGTIGIGAGKKVTLDLYGDNLVEVIASDALQNAMINNKGTIRAEGGRVALSAQAAKNVVDNVINMDGIIDVSSVSTKGGKIVLSGGNNGITRIDGKMNASGTNKGEITVTGQKIRSDIGADLTANNGKIKLSGTEYAEFQGKMTAKNGSASLDGKAVYYAGTTDADKLAITASRADFKNTTVKNGDLDIKADSVNLYGKITDASGKILSDDRMSSTASTVNVHSGKASIQQGIYAAKNSGGTVNVAAGTYNESVNVDRSVTLLGANAGIKAGSATRKAESIVDPNSPGFFITADNAVVDGFEVTGADDGIYASNAQNVSILNNYIHDVNGHGIRLSGSNGATLRGNDIRNTFTVDPNVVNQAHGIYLDHVTGTLVAGNTIDRAIQDGVKDAAGTDNVIRNNDISNSGRIGIYGEGAHSMTVTGNDVSNSNLPVFGGITILGGENHSILRNTVTDNATSGAGAGIYLALSKGGDNRINGNTVSSINGTGIEVHSTRNVEISNNTVTDTDGSAIRLRNSNGTLDIVGNAIGEAATTIRGHGIDISSSNGATLRGNDIRNTFTVDPNVVNQAHGIYLDHVTGTLVAGNTIDRAIQDGVKDAAGTDNVIRNNDISNSGRIGIYGEGAHSMTVTGNDVSNSNLPVFGGITILGGENHSILRNTVTDNATSGAGAGIYLALSKGGDNRINGNTVSSINGTGIEVHSTRNVEISNNTVTDTDGSAIRLRNSNGTLNIVGNAIGEAATTIRGHGIDISSSNGATLRGNDIRNTFTVDPNVVNQAHGIYLDHVTGTLVAGNTIDRAIQDGVKDAAGTDNVIRNNDISNSGRIGIYGEGAHSMTVTGNDVSNSNLPVFGGITILGGENHSILRNTVTDNATSGAGAGIYLALSKGGDNRINGNTVSSINGTGIEVHSTRNVEISNNTVTDTDGSAIRLRNSNGTLDIVGNAIGEAATTIRGHGIDISSSNGATLRGNDIRNTFTVDPNVVNQAHGIYLDHVTGTLVAGNTIDRAIQDGVKDAAGTDNVIRNNDISNSGRIGIYGEGAHSMTVTGNDVSNSNLPVFGGITILGGENHSILRNTVTNDAASGADAGIYLGLTDAGTSVIGRNTITILNGDGIVLRNNTGDVVVRGNTVNGNASGRGISAQGSGNRNIRVANNTLNDSDIGAEFESGTIDLTGNGNDINGGRVGLRFAPAGGNASVLSLVDNDGGPTTAFDPNVTPTNFGGTIGAQTFTGQSEAYIQLANDAFFAPGTPTWLNGLNSSYDGVTPSSIPGNFMTDAMYDALEQRVFHYADDNTLGVFFFGSSSSNSPSTLTPLAALDIDQNDIFNRFGTFNGDVTGLNVRITGLPRTSGGATAGTASLNNIQPAAGNGGPQITLASALNSINTAAGGNDSTQIVNAAYQPTGDLNGIEPAAGGQGNTQSCWSDAMNIASGGQTADIVYQGSLAGSLNQATVCGTDI